MKKKKNQEAEWMEKAAIKAELQKIGVKGELKPGANHIIAMRHDDWCNMLKDKQNWYEGLDGKPYELWAKECNCKPDISVAPI